MNNIKFRKLKIHKDNTEIWIAENVSINCYANYKWYQKLLIKMLLGWKIKNK